MTTADDLDDDDDEVASDIPEEESLTTSLRKALESTPRLPRDRSGVRLAMHYSGLLDDLFDRLDEIGEHRSEDDKDTSVADINRLTSLIAKIGPRYEATLDKLGMFPGARPSARSEGGTPGVSLEAALLAHLQRGALPAGIDPTSAVDPSVTEADARD